MCGVSRLRLAVLHAGPGPTPPPTAAPRPQLRLGLQPPLGGYVARPPPRLTTPAHAPSLHENPGIPPRPRYSSLCCPPSSIWAPLPTSDMGLSPPQQRPYSPGSLCPSVRVETHLLPGRGIPDALSPGVAPVCGARAPHHWGLAWDTARAVGSKSGAGRACWRRGQSRRRAAGVRAGGLWLWSSVARGPSQAGCVWWACAVADADSGEGHRERSAHLAESRRGCLRGRPGVRAGGPPLLPRLLAPQTLVIRVIREVGGDGGPACSHRVCHAPGQVGSRGPGRGAAGWTAGWAALWHRKPGALHARVCPPLPLLPLRGFP